MIKLPKILSPVLIIAFFLLGGCNDDSQTEKEKLPPATQTGENTFGCLVDGKAWVTETSIDAYGFYQSGVLSITALLEKKGVDQGMGFIIHDVNLEERHYVFSLPPDNYAAFGDNILNCGFETNSQYMGTLTVTNFDSNQFIISGLFEFEAYSDDCTKLVKITEGRFDLHYAP